MSWSYDTSLERIRKKYDEVEGIEVSNLEREMDFQNISLLKPKRIHGAHLYVDIPNFAEIVKAAFEEDEEEEILRRLHIYSREITRVIENDLNLAKVHFQGPRLHAVSYRPIGDDGAIAKRAVVAASAVAATVREALNPLFDGADFEVAAGVDLGDAVATMNNVRGDRELLFLGTPANRAAKILSENLVTTQDLADALPGDWDPYLENSGDSTLVLDAPLDFIEGVVEEEELAWSLAACKKRAAETAEAFPVGSVTIHAASGRIDKNKLSLSNSKSIAGVSIFADVDGFTAYIQEVSDDDDDLADAVRAYHVLRSEMRYVAVEDCSALRVQYQGDRVQAVSFLPTDDSEDMALKAIQLGAGLNASVSYTLPEVIGDAALPLAIGEALGPALVSRLGEHGQPDVMCIGPATAQAEGIQLRLDGGEFGISKELRDQLPGDVAEEFRWVSSKSCYMAVDLAADKMERLIEANDLDRGRASVVAGVRERGDTRGRPWHA